MRKPVPQKRSSFSLQMLTNRPTSAALRAEMYTEVLQPIRSPPSYGIVDDGGGGDDYELASPLAYIRTPETPATASFEGPTIRCASYSEVSADRSPRKFNGDAAFASTFSSNSLTKKDRGLRAVSMPVKTESPYDSMFSFSTNLPENLSQTLVVPQTRAAADEASVAEVARPQSSLSQARMGSYSPDGMRISYISDGRRSGSGSYSPVPSRNPRERPATTTRKSSMLNSLGGWLDKRQDSGRQAR